MDPDFCVVARVEALIAGHGMDEAMRRAESYREAGRSTNTGSTQTIDTGYIQRPTGRQVGLPTQAQHMR